MCFSLLCLIIYKTELVILVSDFIAIIIDRQTRRDFFPKQM